MQTDRNGTKEAMDIQIGKAEKSATIVEVEAKNIGCYI
jgi:hypothetical protein